MPLKCFTNDGYEATLPRSRDPLILEPDVQHKRTKGTKGGLFINKKNRQPVHVMEAFETPGLPPAAAEQQPSHHPHHHKEKPARKPAPPVTPSIIQQVVRSDHQNKTNKKKQAGEQEPTISTLLAQSGLSDETLKAPPGIRTINKNEPSSSSSLPKGESSITETQKVRYNEALQDIREAMKW